MIKNVLHPFDTGDFTCVAVNTIGMDNKTVHLDIYGKCGLCKQFHERFKCKFYTVEFEFALVGVITLCS